MNIYTCPIKGDLSRADAVILVEYATGKKVLEVGVGGSTVLLSMFNTQPVISFDNNKEWIDRTQSNLNTYSGFLKSKATIRYSDDYSNIHKHFYEDIHFVFIDCEPRYRWKCFDLLFNKAATGTIFMFHDSATDYVKDLVLKALTQYYFRIASIEQHIRGSNMSCIIKGEKKVYENWNNTEKHNNRVDWFNSEAKGVI